MWLTAGATGEPEELQRHDQQTAARGLDAKSSSDPSGGVACTRETSVDVQLAHEMPAEAFVSGSGDNIAAADMDPFADALPAAFPMHATVSVAVAAGHVGDADGDFIGEESLAEQQMTLAQAAAASYDAPSLLGSTDEARLRPSLQRLQPAHPARSH